MLIDIVVDTNVLAHAQSPNETRFSDAVIFFRKLVESATKLCIDGQFAFGSGNSSLIGQEYISTVGFGGVAYAVLQSLLQANRIKTVSVKVPQIEKKIIESAIPRNKRDRTFVRVAYNSQERRLVSHDWQDFTLNVRQILKKKIDVLIQEAGDAHPDILNDEE